MIILCAALAMAIVQMLSPACKPIAVEEAIAGGAPGAPATYVAMGNLYFESTDAFQSAFAPHASVIYGGYPQLHQHPPRHSDQQGQDVTLPLNQLRPL
jgi:hypothetical protein